MNVNIQYKIKNTKNYYKYLKENSFWIKELNRSSNNYNKFDNYIKDKYRLRMVDKIKDGVDTIDIISTIFKSM